ncbi:hypothetical protein H8959_013450 [Pygathrix nigripes]
MTEVDEGVEQGGTGFGPMMVISPCFPIKRECGSGTSVAKTEDRGTTEGKVRKAKVEAIAGRKEIRQNNSSPLKIVGGAQLSVANPNDFERVNFSFIIILVLPHVLMKWPSKREHQETKWYQVRNIKINTHIDCSCIGTSMNPRRDSRIIEAICIGWFTAECIVRFIVSKNKCEFVKRPLNIIDLLAITPYYISVLMTVFTGENSQLQRAGVTLRVLRMMRIFWVIKLARHFIGLQTLGLTLKRCYREMVMLLVFICVAMAIFSALSQLLEHGLDLETSNKDFTSIPAACWWVIISMTTVGYGDMYPITVPGRILGGVCVVSGIVLLALPITFIYHSFVQCYHELKFRSARYSRSLSAEFLN